MALTLFYHNKKDYPILLILIKSFNKCIENAQNHFKLYNVRMRYLILVLTIFFTALNSFALDVVYPKTREVSINSNTTFFIGSADANSILTINGEKVPVHTSGGFAHFVTLKKGENLFVLKSNDEELIFNINKKEVPQSSKKSVFIPFSELKSISTAHDNTTIRTTPIDGGINRAGSLPENIELLADGEQNGFYRITMNENEKFWVAKTDVKPQAFTNPTSLFILSRDFQETSKDYIYTFTLNEKIPYVVRENNDDEFENGIGLSLYNPLATNGYEMYFPVQHQLFGYGADFEDNKLILKIRKLPKISQHRPLKNIKITVDAGHGGSENGAIGCLGDKEKDINLDVAQRLERILITRGAKVVMTRNTDEKVSLSKRVEIANENDSSIFVSIHSNALPDSKNPIDYRGSGTYYYYPQAKTLAEEILSSLNTDANTQNDGVHQASFAVVRNTKAISVLVELAYLINPEDNALLINKDFRQKCAVAIANGLENYLRNAK